VSECACVTVKGIDMQLRETTVQMWVNKKKQADAKIPLRTNNSADLLGFQVCGETRSITCNSKTEIPAFDGLVSDPNQGFALKGARYTLNFSSQYLNEAEIAFYHD
jgi:hypothetical protein